MLVRISLKWGLLLGVAVSLATQILTWVGLGLSNWFVLISIILSVVFVALASKEIHSLQGGKLSFVNALATVLILVLVARLIFQIYMFIYTRYIDPSWVDTVAESWAVTLQDSGSTADQIDQQIQSFRKAYEILLMFTVALVIYAIPQFFWGIITSLFFVFDVRGRLKKWRASS